MANIPQTTIPVGQSTFSLGTSTQQYSNAEVDIDRTVAGGLNSLPNTATLSLILWAQLPGSGAWVNVGGLPNILGGTYVIKGITTTGEGWRDSVTPPFPAGTVFEVRAQASQQVVIAGTYLFS